MKKSWTFIMSSIAVSFALSACGGDSSGSAEVSTKAQPASAQNAGSANAASDTKDNTVTNPVHSRKPAGEPGTLKKEREKKKESSIPLDAKFNPMSRVINQVGDKEYSAFSLTPVDQDTNNVVLTAVPSAAGDTPAAKDSLVFMIDGEVKSYSLAKGRKYDYVVDKKTLESLDSADQVLIQLVVGKDTYFEGQYKSGDSRTFRESIDKFMK